MTPYREPGERPDEPEETEPPRDLGALISKHVQTGPRSWTDGMLGGSLTVARHERGLIFEGDGGGELFFEDIDAIYFDCASIVWNGVRSMDLVSFEGDVFRLPMQLERVERIVDALDSEVIRPIAARAAEAFRSGESLKFGPIDLTSDELSLQGKPLAWSDVGHVTFERDSVVIHAKGNRPDKESAWRFGWCRLIEVPHPHALIAALRVRTQVVYDGLDLPNLR